MPVAAPEAEPIVTMETALAAAQEAAMLVQSLAVPEAAIVIVAPEANADAVHEAPEHSSQGAAVPLLPPPDVVGALGNAEVEADKTSEAEPEPTIEPEAPPPAYAGSDGVHGWSVHQLKEFLATRGVDARGFTEKREFIVEVQRLIKMEKEPTCTEPTTEPTDLDSEPTTEPTEETAIVVLALDGDPLAEAPSMESSVAEV